MKKIIISAILLLLSVIAFSQITDNYWNKLESTANNFSQVSDSFDIYINSTYPDSIPQDKLGNIKNYFRFVNFWKSRTGEINNEVSYKPYQDAILNLLTDPVCNGEDPANWELVGPVSYGSQMLGLVSQVLHNPQDSGDYILSSDYGGLWKSQATGESWKNITDMLRIPGLSATEMIRNPKNNNHIIVSTTGGLHSANYGIGIIESFDNGETWSVMQGFPHQNAPVVQKVLYDPYQSFGNEIALYAITKKEIYHSINTGLTWSLISGPPISDFDDYIDIEVVDINGTTGLFLSTKYRYNGVDGKIFRLRNGNWEDILQTASVITPFQSASGLAPY